MALRRLARQTRRLLREINGSKSRAAGQLDIALQRRFLRGLSPQALPRGNASSICFTCVQSILAAAFTAKHCIGM